MPFRTDLLMSLRFVPSRHSLEGTRENQGVASIGKAMPYRTSGGRAALVRGRHSRFALNADGTSALPAFAARYYERSFSRSRSLTTLGFAFPFEAFITWPTKNPNRASLPDRKCSS